MKIRANKYTNIDLSVVGLSAYIFNIVKDTGLVKYDELQSKVISKKGKSAKNNFQHALVFLYSLNKIEYHTKDDVFSLVEAQ